MASSPPSGRAPVLVVMGVSGTGKSTIAAALAAALGWPWQEGDDLHPPGNIAKMAAGAPLDDADRAPWLAAVRGWIDARAAAGEPGVITCSALRRRYRDVLRAPAVRFVALEVPRGELARRVARRHGHFMPASLLASQLELYEPPAADEPSITIETTGTPAEQVARIIAALRLAQA